MINKTIWKLILFVTFSTWVGAQECPPSDTLSIDQSQNLWNIPLENQWDEVEVMTWNIENFPLDANTIDYVNEIISDLLPDIIAFQEINSQSSFTTLGNSLPAYEFISSGSGLALAVRSDVVEIVSWSTLFPNAGYEFAWRYPFLVELNWLCGTSAISLQIINIHLKAGGNNEDFNRRYASCQLLSNYVDDNPAANIIILGDYNDEITESQSSNSLWPLVSDDAIAFTTDPIANIDYYASYPSWPSFIDHIAASTPLFDELSGGNIKTIRIDDYTGYSFYHDYISDHRPVLWSFPIEEVELAEGLVINEIMQNPAVVGDAAGEWIEITNISDSIIDLHGLILRDNGGEQHIINTYLAVSPGSFVILGASDDPSLNGGIIIDYEYSDFFLTNSWDEVILSHPTGIIIDEVFYDNGTTFPDENGSSMMLLDPYLDNSLGENWGVADVQFGTGDYGTPGQPNYSIDCALGDVNCDGGWNVMDIVTLANCVLAEDCEELENAYTGDVNGDGIYNVMDIVILANCVLAENCDA